MANAPKDQNRISGLLALDTVSGLAAPLSGLYVGTTEALTVAIVDGSGNQIVSFGGGTQYANGAAQATPTGTVALGWDGANVRALSTDTTGKLNITGSISATNPSVGTTGAAIPTSATLLGASDGVNLQPLQVDASKNLKVLLANSSVAVTGTFWQATQPVSLASLPSLAAGSNNIGGVEIIDSGGTNKLAVNASGQIAISNFPTTQPVSGTVTANAGTGNFTIIQATASNLNAQVVGNVASAATDSGNPVKIGGVFNTTQPTVTTGQRVDAQMSARGAQIVATGVDTFNVTVNAALPTGSNTIGAVNQGGSNWSVNNAQIAGATLATAASGVQKVGVVGSAGAAFDVSSAQNQTTPANMIMVGAEFNTTPTTITTGNASPLQLDSAANLLVNLKTSLPTGSNVIGAVTQSGTWNIGSITTLPALPAGTNLIGKVGIDQTTVGSTNAVTPIPASNSGWSFAYYSGLTNSVQQIKGTAGTFGGYLWLYNPNTATTFIQVFNKASASVTLGTTAPDYVIALPGVASASATGSAANMEMVMGIAMSTGISVAATTTATGSTAPTNTLSATFLYK